MLGKTLIGDDDEGTTYALDTVPAPSYLVEQNQQPIFVVQQQFAF